MFEAEKKPGYPDFWHHMDYIFKEDSVYTQSFDSDRKDIIDEMLKRKNSIFVEIGIYGGATLLSLYDTCKENDNKVFGIDPHDKINIYNGASKEETSEEAKTNAIKIFSHNRKNLQKIIKKYKIDDIITYINETSSDAIKYFEDNSIDLLHIDGDHSYEGVYSDLLLYYPKVKNNGIIICDDFNWVSVKNGITDFCNNFNVKNINDYGKKAVIKKIN